MRGILHIPHSSQLIPDEYLKYFCLTPRELDYELLKMTDHYTDELFNEDSYSLDRLQFPVSRLLVDPERFPSDTEEVMAKVGMGCIYELTHDGQPLKDASNIRDELIDRYYRPHHKTFETIVQKIINDGQDVLIFDCHSFPKHPLPYEINQTHERAEICIGTDKFHTPNNLRNLLETKFRELGFSVAINKPFSGSIVPMKFWQIDTSVKSVMIEIRRDLYINEETGKKSKNFEKIKNNIKEIIESTVSSNLND